MKETKLENYRSVVKTTALFGGVQGVSAILSLFRNKAIALLLGVEGVGIISLLTTSLQLIQSITSLGVDRSGVREIAAQANEEGELRTASVIRLWSLILGLFGAALMLVVAPSLSQVLFGNDDYTLPFRLLSIALLFETLSKGNLALFQGRRMLVQLAKSTLWGAFGGLLLSLPLYLLYGIEAIAPSMVLSSIVAWVVSRYYLNGLPTLAASIRFNQRLAEGRPLIRLGVAFTLSSASALLSAYLFSLYMTRQAGVEELGLYQAGYNMVMRYVGLLFAAMATDYYPQLTQKAIDSSAIKALMNRQSEIALLLLLPVALLFILFAEPIILILLSKEFLPTLPFVQWSLLGIVVKVLSWAIGFVILAKGLSRLFWVTELISALLFLGGNILGYNLMGLEGIGISYVVAYTIYLLILTIYMKRNYSIAFALTTYKLFGVLILLVSTAIVIIKFTEGWPRYGLSVVLLSLSFHYAWRELNRRVGIKEMIQIKFRKG